MGTRIRLWGISTGERPALPRADSDLYQCGAKAANDLDTFIARRPVDCTPVAEDQYGWTVATLFRRRCRSRRMACAQWSRAGLPQYSKGKYALPSARPIVRVRMWAGSYVEPCCFVAASGRVGLRSAVRMMQTHILERAFMRRLGASQLRGLNQRRVSLRDLFATRAKQSLSPPHCAKE